jgi:hypothetical protein
MMKNNRKFLDQFKWNKMLKGDPLIRASSLENVFLCNYNQEIKTSINLYVLTQVNTQYTDVK